MFVQAGYKHHYSTDLEDKLHPFQFLQNHFLDSILRCHYHFVVVYQSADYHEYPTKIFWGYSYFHRVCR